MNIDSCICHKRTFKSIKEECEKLNINSLIDLKNILKICNKCCMCNPYIDEMFETGQVKFNKIYELEKTN